MNKELYISTIKEGSVLVGGASIVHPTQNMIGVTVHLSTKYAQVFTYGLEDNTPSIWLYADHNSLDVNDRFSLEDPTVISFPELNGWIIFAISNPGRYEFNVVFVRKT